MNTSDLMKCFEPYIGVLGCKTSDKCLHLVNRLAGMSTELLDKIADNDQETWYGVYEDALVQSLNILKDDVEAGMKTGTNAHRFGNVLFRSEAPRPFVPNVTVPVEGDWFGVLFVAPYSRFVVAEMNSIAILSVNPNPQTTILKVFDLYENKELHAQTVDIVQGLNIIEFTQLVDSVTEPISLLLEKDNHAYFIGVEIVGDLQLGQLVCNRWHDSECRNCDPCDMIGSDGQKWNRQHFSGNYDAVFEIVPVWWNSADDLNYENLNVSSMPMACFNVSLECSIDSFICQNAKRLSGALVYLVAAHLLLQKLTSFRVNYHAKGNMEITKELRKEYESKYAKALKTILPTLPITGESICLECMDEGFQSNSLV